MPGAVGDKGRGIALVRLDKALEKRRIHFIVLLADTRANPGKKRRGRGRHCRDRRRNNTAMQPRPTGVHRRPYRRVAVSKQHGHTIGGHHHRHARRLATYQRIALDTRLIIRRLPHRRAMHLAQPQPLRTGRQQRRQARPSRLDPRRVIINMACQIKTLGNQRVIRHRSTGDKAVGEWPIGRQPRDFRGKKRLHRTSKSL